jgi:predicted glycosyltransferase
LPIDDIVGLRSRLILEAFEGFAPDVILVDHMPVGALGELKPLLEAVTRAASRPRLFLGLRDILGSPEANSRVWTDLDAYAYLRHYDSVLIYGCRDIYDAESAYQLTYSARKVTYCNYVSSDPGGTESLDTPDEPVLLAMGGGGHDFFPIAKAFLEAVPILLQRIQLRPVILTGPNMAPSEREALLAQSARYRVQILHNAEDATPWLQRSSAVVTMAGYNSLCEVLAWRKKAIAVPRAGPSAEQRMRAELFARRRLVRTLDPVSLTPDALADEVMQLMMEDRIPDAASIPPLDGAENAATLLLAQDVMPVCQVGSQD